MRGLRQLFLGFVVTFAITPAARAMIVIERPVKDAGYLVRATLKGARAGCEFSATPAQIKFIDRAVFKRRWAVLLSLWPGSPAAVPVPPMLLFYGYDTYVRAGQALYAMRKTGRGKLIIGDADTGHDEMLAILNRAGVGPASCATTSGKAKP